jgi:hypothetical protein
MILGSILEISLSWTIWLVAMAGLTGYAKIS